MIGRTLGGATVATIQGLLVLILVTIFGFRPYSWALVPVAILFMLLVALLFAALGAMIGSLLDDMQGFQLIMNFLVMPLFFLSGALFPLDGLPAVLTILVKFDPLSYGIDSFRILLTGIGSFGLGLDFAVIAIVTAVFLGLGSYFFSKIQV
jgi:ABC-2 type transport system permease protein